MAGVVGTGIQQPPAQLLNTMDAITQKYIVPILADQVLKPSPTWWALTRKGKKFKGGELVYPLLTAEELTGGAYYGDQLLNTAITDSIQPANQVWRHYYQAVSLPVTDIIANAGSGLDILQLKMEAASGSMLQKLNRALWHTSPQNTSIDVDDIESWIGSGLPAAPNVTTVATNNIAGIDRSQAANSFWLPQNPADAGNATVTTGVMEGQYQNCTFGYDEPDLIVSDQTRYASFKNIFVPNVRYGDNIQDEEAVQAGIRYHFLYNNAVVLQDKFAPANIYYIINTKYMFPVFHPASYFRVKPWLAPTNQDVIVSTFFVTWQLANIGPRMGGKVVRAS